MGAGVTVRGGLEPRVLTTRPIVGLCLMQVCAVLDATDAEILAHCNAANPAGTEQGWVAVIRSADPARARVAPVSCSSHPDTRVHLLVEC